MAFKFAFLGCWHSHTGMHVRESTANPSEFELVGIYDNDPVVVAESLQLKLCWTAISML